MNKIELMNQYEAEMDEVSTWTWHNKEFVTDDVLDWAWEKIQKLQAENAQMKAQLTWRPVSEKPKESDRYIVKYRQGKIVKKFIADYDVVLGWNIPLPDVEILEYLPIPPAPEGE